MSATTIKKPAASTGSKHLFQELDRGIDDMEAGREMSIEDAFIKIEELRKIRKSERI
ncbi:MAG: hypothetical protein LUI39_13475 [Lachnospiraceae bacterium]|nr:hypothetical protein [Lachnospiraceae bacterium]